MNFSEIADEKLAEIAIENENAFAFLVEKFTPKLRNFVGRISDFPLETIDEILQESFLKAWKNLRGFDSSQKFSTWIFAIARNETFSLFRKFTARGEKNRVDFDDENLTNLPTEIFGENFDREILAKKTRQILQKLPRKYREILVLFFLEQKSYDEISAILKIPGGTVAARISRGKIKFKNFWNEK